MRAHPAIKTRVNSASANQPFVFTPGASASPAAGTDSLVQETRREISEIIREVAASVRTDQSEQQFLSFLVDRVVRAMAAEGVIVWKRLASSSACLQAVSRVGRLTDESIAAESIATHNNLIGEVASTGQPVVVPATPGCRDATAVANPMDTPAALVPITCDPDASDADYLLEVFLEPECGVAAQRGYLRFVAQMADLAGEFLRANRVRQLRRQQTLAAQVDVAIEQLQLCESLREVEATIVDQSAELFSCDRVGLCIGTPPELKSVSHVTQIDQRTPAAKQLREAATLQLDHDYGRLLTEDDTPNAQGRSDELMVRACVGCPSNDSFRLIFVQANDAEPFSESDRCELVRFARHAEFAHRHVELRGSKLGWLHRLRSQHRRSAKVIATTLVLAALASLSLIPIPLVVHGDAFLRPSVAQRLITTRDAQVDEIHVTHGDRVSRGQPLVTLSDPALDAEIASLRGQKAVLLQEQTQLTAEIVDTSTRELDRLDQLQGRREVLEQEVQTLATQIGILQSSKDSLVLRSRIDGVVDAWQVERVLQDRPLKRGDELLQVIATDSGWIADTRVAQSRVGHLQRARESAEVDAHVTLLSQPERAFGATIQQIGPSLQSDAGGPSKTAVLLQMNDDGLNRLGTKLLADHPPGAPAKVLFHCGTAPAAYCLFQDLYRSARRMLTMHGVLGESSKGIDL